MNYKESARSPHYGRIYGYDESGKEAIYNDIHSVISTNGTVPVILKLNRD